MVAQRQHQRGRHHPRPRTDARQRLRRRHPGGRQRQRAAAQPNGARRARRSAAPRWRELYRHALKEAARLDLEISLNVESGWNLGGPAVQPEHAAKLLTFSRVTAQGPGEIRRALPRPPAKIDYYRDIAVLAYPLDHGESLPARPIRQLALKTAALEFGMSAPVTTSLLEDPPAEPGEQDRKSPR